MLKDIWDLIVFILIFFAICWGLNANAYAYGGYHAGRGSFSHSGNNRIHKQLHHRIHPQHYQSYIEGGIHVTP